MAIASSAPREPTHVEDPTRTAPLELTAHHAGRPPWSAPRGRDLLAGVAVLAVLLAILVVFTRDFGAPPPGSTSAQPLLRGGVAAVTAAAAPDWSEVPLVTRVEELGPALAGPVADGLAQARERIRRCVAVERRRRGAAAEVPDEAGPAQVVLRLAPRSSAVHVVGLEPKATGASAELADCARRQLDGDAFPAASAVPGRRHRLLVVLE